MIDIKALPIQAAQREVKQNNSPCPAGPDVTWEQTPAQLPNTRDIPEAAHSWEPQVFIPDPQPAEEDKCPVRTGATKEFEDEIHSWSCDVLEKPARDLAKGPLQTRDVRGVHVTCGPERNWHTSEMAQYDGWASRAYTYND